MSGMVVLGVDPGLAVTGYGVVQDTGRQLIPVTYGCIRTASSLTTTERLVIIYQGLKDVIREFTPGVAAVEELFFNKNARSAFLVGEARGVALLAVAHQDLEAHEYTPLQVKQSVTGYGRASKGQVQDMVQVMLKLKEPVRPDDAADALALSICHLHFWQWKLKGLI